MTDEADRRRRAETGQATGETSRLGSRRLDRAPGERYGAFDSARPGPAATATAPGATFESTDGVTAARAGLTDVRPRRGRGLLFGLGAALVLAVVWAVAGGLFDVGWRLMVVAGLGGWVIGRGVAAGAWRALDHLPDRRVRSIAVALGVVTWLLGTFGAYLVGLLILPGSSAPLAARMANAPFVDAAASQFSVFDIVELALLTAVGWRAAR